MAAIHRISWDPTAYVTALPGGIALGDTQVDKDGVMYRVVLLDSTLTGSTTTAGNMLVMKNSTTATDVLANGQDVTNQVPAGVCLSGSAPVSSYVLLAIKGYVTSVKSTGTINAGDTVIASASVSGAVSAPTQSTSVTYALRKAIVGTARAAASGGAVTLQLNID